MKSGYHVIVLSALTTLATVLLVGVVAQAAGTWSVHTGFQGRQPTVSSSATGTNARLADRSPIAAAVEESSPAVVSVIATKKVPVLERFYERDPRFFGMPVPRYRQKGTEKQQVGGGSGFLVSADGLVVTNRHVVSDTEASYTVLMKDGTKHEAEVIARDSVIDIAVLDIDGSSFPHLSFANSDTLKPGQTVIAIGNALGEFTNSVSVGVVSGLSRSITAGGGFRGRPETLRGVIQTDAAINPGNSGGPLLNRAGQVVGVNVARAQGSENIGFALPANEVSSIVESVKETGEIVRPFLGVRYVPVTEEVAQRFDLSVEHGALLIGGPREGLAVMPDSPASKAGLREGDVILSIDGKRIDTSTPLSRRIRSFEVGETVRITIMRDGERMSVTATLSKTPDNAT